MAEQSRGQMRRRQKTQPEQDGLMARIGRFFKQANEQSGVGQIRKANEAKAKQERQRKNVQTEVDARASKDAEAKARTEKYKAKAQANKEAKEAANNKSAPKRTNKKPSRTGQMPNEQQAQPKKTSKTTTANAGKSTKSNTSAGSFKTAFAKARKNYMSGKGGSTFEWNGKKYSVATKDDIQKSGKKDLKEYLNAGMTPKRK
jgi:hypothetical protein